MPCYGHSHCALCNVPVCPDCIGNQQSDDEDDNKTVSPDIDLEVVPYKWLNNGVAIYENNEIYEVSMYEEGILGVLCDKNEKGKFHNHYANVKSALFLHSQCYDHVLKYKDIIPTKNIWWFLAVYNIGINAHKIKDESDYFHCQNSLHQYYHKGDYDENVYENSDVSFIWLLENPAINERNMKRICDKFDKMLTTYDWSQPFSIGGYRLK